MDAKKLFERAIRQATDCIKGVKPEQLGNATPCTEWNLAQLLNHMVYELLWVPDLLAGKTVAEIGDKYEGDVLGDDPAAAWNKAAKTAEAAAQKADLKDKVHLSYGDKSVEFYLNEIGGDILVHAWDVCQSLSYSLVFEQELAQAVYENTLPRKDEFAKSSLFGTPVEVPEDAGVEEKLLGLMGRKAKKD